MATTTSRAGVMSRLYTGTGAFDIVGRRKLWYLAFGALILVCVASIVFRGFNLGIDFTGGTQFQFPTVDAAAPVEVEAVRDVYQGVVGNEPIVQIAGSGVSEAVLIRGEALDQAQIVAVKQALFDAFQPVGAAGVPAAEAISDSAVSGSWGGQITRQALIALAVFLVLVTIFLTVYFERSMAIAALVALVHDVVVTAGIYSLIGFEVTPGTVIGLLTILGFSLYDTVVVFDKVSENTRGLLALSRRTWAEAANLALNQTLMRSINTSITSVLPVLSMLLIGSVFLGALTLQEFAIALLIGILVGTYSSIFVAASVVAYMKEREAENRAVADKVRAREGETGTRRVSEDDVALAGIPTTRERPSRSGSRTSSSQRPSRGQAAQRGAAAKRAPASARPGQPPKPRKKKKS